MTAGKKTHLLLRVSIGFIMSELKKLRNLSKIACPVDIPTTFLINKNLLINLFLFTLQKSTPLLTKFCEIMLNKKSEVSFFRSISNYF